MPSMGLMALLAMPGQTQLIRALSHLMVSLLLLITCFGLQRLKVEDGDSGGLTAGACSRWHWKQKPVHHEHGLNDPRLSPNNTTQVEVPAISGFTAPVTGFPLPIGALTKSRKSASGWLEYRLAALQVSITEPPPTATNTSNEPFLANEMASLKLQQTGVIQSE